MQALNSAFAGLRVGATAQRRSAFVSNGNAQKCAMKGKHSFQVEVRNMELYLSSCGRLLHVVCGNGVYLDALGSRTINRKLSSIIDLRTGIKSAFLCTNLSTINQAAADTRFFS